MKIANIRKFLAATLADFTATNRQVTEVLESANQDNEEVRCPCYNRSRPLCARPGVTFGGVVEKHSKHHKLSDWLGVLSSDSKDKLRKAKNEALKDPEVAAAKIRKDQADSEYRELLQRQMLKADPSVEPTSPDDDRVGETF